MGVEENLAAAGYTLPPAPTPAGAYVPATRTGTLVYTSGQLPMVEGALPAKFSGRVGHNVSADTAHEAAAQCAVNALAALKGLLGDLDQIERVVKVVGFVASEPSFSDQPEVMNGASELLRRVFGDAGQHARSAVGVVALPRNACVEVELIVQVRETATP